MLLVNHTHEIEGVGDSARAQALLPEDFELQGVLVHQRAGPKRCAGNGHRVETWRAGGRRCRHGHHLALWCQLSRPGVAVTGRRRGAPKWYVSGFLTKKWYVLFFCQFISDHCVCRNQTTLQIGNAHEYTVRRQRCCLSRASGVIVVRFWASGSFCNSGFWLRLFVARFWLADVG